MGKTSLLARGLQQARTAGAAVVLTDFQKLNAPHLESIDAFFLALSEMIYDQLDVDIEPEDAWSPRRGPSINSSATSDGLSSSSFAVLSCGPWTR